MKVFSLLWVICTDYFLIFTVELFPGLLTCARLMIPKEVDGNALVDYLGKKSPLIKAAFSIRTCFI